MPDSAEATVPEWNTWSVTPAQRSVQWKDAQSLRSIVPATRPDAEAMAFVSVAPPAESTDAMKQQSLKTLVKRTELVELTSISKAVADEDEMTKSQPIIVFDLNSVTSFLRRTTERAAVVRSVSEPNVQLRYVAVSEPRMASCAVVRP